MTNERTPEQEALLRWKMAQGTPKTLKQAIRNALDEMAKMGLSLVDTDPVPFIYLHVRDFLSQKFSLFMNGCGDAVDLCAKALWEKITGEVK